ncbi:hypothetical protein [Maritimibacter alexandrii]|uniref:hypothetical protein n=1 Tax=Maritimibacter alexandrii TaxID=2570355 RepID=UPI001109A6B0|nr:hypothetical protein [Maritimibacter alexandrii]
MQAESPTLADQAEDRLSEFREDFGGDGQFEVGIVKGVHAISDVCGIFFGPEATDDGLDTMLRHRLGEVVDHHGWRGALEEEVNGLYSELPIGGLFHDLHAYADYGVYAGVATDTEARRGRISEMIEQASEFLRLIPVDGWGLEDTQTVDIARKAIARWRLEQGDPITGPDLVLLSGKAEQTVRNELSKKKDGLAGNWKEVPASAALAWLETKSFLASIWQHQDDTELLEQVNEPLTDVCFVPIAMDGSMFHPGLKKDGVYLLGGEGRERAVEDFDEALSILATMDIPTWRRPTSGGIWTRVRGNTKEFRRIERKNLEAMAKADTS